MKQLALILLVCSMSAAMAQTTPPSAPPPPPAGSAPPVPPAPPAPSMERMESMKIAFISNKLSLTPDEAKAFWPLYDKFEEEKKALRDDDPQPLDEMTDAEVNSFIKGFTERKQKELDLYKKYIPEFKKILSDRKVAKLLTLDAEFKRMLLMQAKGGHGPGGPGPKYMKGEPGQKGSWKGAQPAPQPGE